MTLRGRRYLFNGTDKLHVGRSTVRALTIETYQKVIQHNFFHTTRGWAMIFVVLTFYGCFVLLRRFPKRTAVLVLWAILHYASYCVTLPATGHGGRYQPFVLLLFPALLAIALFDLIALAFLLFRSRGSALLRPMQAFALVAVAALTAVTLPRWSVALGDSIYNIDNCHLKMAEYLNANYPPGTKMGVFDIGAIGYFSHIDLIDLGGLVDRNYLPYLLSGRVPSTSRKRVSTTSSSPTTALKATLTARDRQPASATRYTSSTTPRCAWKRSTPKASTTPHGTPAISTPSTPTVTRRSTASSASTPAAQPLPRPARPSPGTLFDRRTRIDLCRMSWQPETSS